MSANFVTVLLVILFCGSVFGLRTNFFSAPSRSGVSRLGFVDADEDGICKSMVETRDYPCEEHTVTTQDVGHSLGTLIVLAAFSQDQVMNMMRSAVLLSPIAYVGQLTSPLARNAAEKFLAETLRWLGVHEFNLRGGDYFVTEEAVIDLLKAICSNPGIDCTDLLSSFTVIRSGRITKYDYDDEDHYGKPTPPAYEMKSIPNDFPLYLSNGGADAVSDVRDVEHLAQQPPGSSRR